MLLTKRMVKMQLATDILRFLFFPGLLFMVFCGYLVLLLEGRLRVALYGGGGTRLRTLTGAGAEMDTSSPGELAAVVLSLAGMGVAGILLVGVKGDLFALLLLFSAVEILPLFLAAAVGAEEALRAPLLFRTAFFRLAALACVMLSISLRFPAVFSPGLETFRGEGAFNAVQLWSGVDFALILASLVCAAIAFFVFLLGHSACGVRYEAGETGQLKGFYCLAAEGSQRAVSLLFFAILFLGYPWEGGMGMLLWSAAALGTAVFFTVVRAWLDGCDRVFLRKLQGAAPLFALLSLALAIAAVV